MNSEESLSNSTCTDQPHMAERQLAAFISAVFLYWGLCLVIEAGGTMIESPGLQLARNP